MEHMTLKNMPVMWFFPQLSQTYEIYEMWEVCKFNKFQNNKVY